ncbi:hypothetical protein [Fusobacterium necrophorum]|uniref:hypothetical protein n=1 Tax=Fusobacterium necrophorum TaxID=859 RepID=UPI00370F5221
MRNRKKREEELFGLDLFSKDFVGGYSHIKKKAWIQKKGFRSTIILYGIEEEEILSLFSEQHKFYPFLFEKEVEGYERFNMGKGKRYRKVIS